MPVSWQQLYADRTAGMRASDIREILKVTAQPDIISLAGGLPAPELFPVDEYRRAFEWVLETSGAEALQYGPSEGYRPLRALLAERLTGFGMRSTTDDVLVTNGSQQALDLIGKILLNPGDTVLVEKPTYMGALQAFNQYQANYAVVPMDEDDPYGELRYEGQALPTLKALDRNDSVMYLGTFSKILAPGFRLGWILASPQVQEILLHGKQPSDLHTGMAQQMATYQVAKDGFVDEHVKHIKDFYRERRDVMLRAIEEHFPPDAHYTRPLGGLFVWAELPPGIDTRELLLDAIQEKVAFVPGQGFHPDLSGSNTMRLNFSNVPPDQLREGVRRLGLAIPRRLAVASPVSSGIA